MLRYLALLLIFGFVQTQIPFIPLIPKASLRSATGYQFLEKVQTQTNNLLQSTVPQATNGTVQQQAQAIQKNAQLAAQKLISEYTANNLKGTPIIKEMLESSTSQLIPQTLNLTPFQGIPIICQVDCKCENLAGVCSSCKDIKKTIQSNCTSCRAPLILKNNTCENPKCPKQCVCAGKDKWTCTSCADKNALLNTNCIQCHSGYKKQDGICKPIKVCPKACNCLENSNVCSTCKDVNMDPTTLCVSCKQNFTLNKLGDCAASCPQNCLCQGNITNICTSCKDANKNVNSSCDQCNEGYALVAESNTCKPLPCPSLCECKGINPSFCTICKDLSADLNTNCTICQAGFVKTQNNTCVAGTCPPTCSCTGANPTVCTACKDSNKLLTSNCVNCTDGFVLNSQTGICEKAVVPNCPSNCVCNEKGACVACKQQYRLPALSCNYCIPGYNMVDNICVKGCFGGCKCEQQDPTECSSCVDSQKNPLSFCICPLGKIYNTTTNACTS